MVNVLALNAQNYVSPAILGGTLGFSLGTGRTQILPGDPQVRELVFSNPGTVAIYVCQAFDANGQALTPGPNPGNWQILPGASLIFSGNGVAGPWLAAAASGSGNPLTVAGLPGVPPGEIIIVLDPAPGWTII